MSSTPGTALLQLPPRINESQLRFAAAAGLILQGGGRVTVDEAASLAGMDRRAFIGAIVALGPEMAAAMEDAIDADACREADEEMKQPGAKLIPFDQAMARLGIDSSKL